MPPRRAASKRSIIETEDPDDPVGGGASDGDDFVPPGNGAEADDDANAGPSERKPRAAAPRKRARTNGSAPAGRKRAAKLEYFQSMPIDVLNEICGYLDSATLLAMSRVTKGWRAILLAPGTNHLWVTARENVGIPAPTATDITEPGLAHLVYGRHCYVCGKDRVQKVDYGIRMRCYSLSDLEVYMNQRLVLVQQIEADGEELKAWDMATKEARSEELANLRATRRIQIMERASEHGFTEADEEFTYSDAFADARLLTERIWNGIEEQVLAAFAAGREQRLYQELCQRRFQRRDELEDLYNMMVDSQTTEHDKATMMPLWMFQQLDVLKRVWEEDGDDFRWTNKLTLDTLLPDLKSEIVRHRYEQKVDLFIEVMCSLYDARSSVPALAWAKIQERKSVKKKIFNCKIVDNRCTVVERDNAAFQGKAWFRLEPVELRVADRLEWWPADDLDAGMYVEFNNITAVALHHDPACEVPVLTVTVGRHQLRREIHFHLLTTNGEDLKDLLDVVVAAFDKRLEDLRVDALVREGSTLSVDQDEPFTDAEMDAVLDRATAYVSCDVCRTAHHWTDVCGPSFMPKCRPGWTKRVVSLFRKMGFEDDAPKSALKTLVRPIFSCETCLDKYDGSDNPRAQALAAASDGVLWDEMVSLSFLTFQKLGRL
ncbi:hypothetical protein RQP46_011370 [Phenoliferia psychrophenolica]